VISRDTEWAKLYERLVQAKCPVDPRTGERSGKLRTIGRIAGQLIETFTEVFLFVPNIESDQAC
jgi:hypothetical protein